MQIRHDQALIRNLSKNLLQK